MLRRFVMIRQFLARQVRRSCAVVRGQSGVSLFELLVAVMLLAMASSMVYSVMNASIRFSQKGEMRLQKVAREHGMLDLLRRQIRCAVYDETNTRQAIMSATDEVFRVVTRKPLLYRQAGIVLALYRYRQEERAIYYTEKIDYYNLDYDETFVPDFDEMVLLGGFDFDLALELDEQTGVVTVTMGETSYEFFPKASKRRIGNQIIG